MSETEEFRKAFDTKTENLSQAFKEMDDTPIALPDGRPDRTTALGPNGIIPPSRCYIMYALRFGIHEAANLLRARGYTPFIEAANYITRYCEVKLSTQEVALVVDVMRHTT